MSTTELPVLPLKNGVLFPFQIMPLTVGRPSSFAAMEAAMESEDKTIVIVAQKDSAIEDPVPDQLYDVGTVAVVKHMQRTPAGLQVIVQGVTRCKLAALASNEPYLKFKIEQLPDPQDGGTEVEALVGELLRQAMRAFELMQPATEVPLDRLLGTVKDPIHYAYLLGAIFSFGVDREQAVLAASTRAEALKLMHEYLTHEVQVLELRHKIASQAKTEMDRQQRDYLLRQQMQAIRAELGEESAEQADVAELRERLREASLPEFVHKEVEKELVRLERIPVAAPDYQITRTYVELALELPWNKLTEDVLQLNRAREILDQDHFDLAEIKDRIVEHLAVMKLNPVAKAPVLCFVGPPGVGKTSLGQSIARAMGRKFERMSLGGLHDEAELRGHRRTYIGAMPGRIIQAIRRAGVRNPLLMLDEVDKLGRDFRGDPASALMEVLDTAQNTDFHDNYLDLPFDLSKVFFITTANTLDSIPKPLLDRMEVLRLPGYSDEEKREIARRYLIPRRLSEAGLSESIVVIPDETLDLVIRRYTREAGVRELERMIGRVARKVATKIAALEEVSADAASSRSPVTVTPVSLAEMLGPEKFFLEEARQAFGPGVATGLAWTESGGEVLYIEAVKLPGIRGMTVTGQLGEVMQESAKAALSYIRSQSASLGLDQNELRRTGVHIHVPAGAVPKDGPSAGITMATALVSLYTGCPVRSDTAMTGEITLTGLVLPVGGIKEKVLAAHRAGLRRVILPKENRKDLREMPAQVSGEMEFLFAVRVEDVFAAAIPELGTRPRAVA